MCFLEGSLSVCNVFQDFTNSPLDDKEEMMDVESGEGVSLFLMLFLLRQTSNSTDLKSEHNQHQVFTEMKVTFM